MNLYLYNTLTRKKERFQPLDTSRIKMYVCGPTVYDSPHIGNARSAVTYDVLYRVLNKIFGKAKVQYVRNITDVDDKIIKKSLELGISIQELTDNITKEFHQNMQYLGCISPTIEPKATEHIPQMIEIIEQLIAKKHAYVVDNHVYFDILSAPFYTELSNQDLDAMLEGVRIENNTSKRHPGDFVLWKPAKDGEGLLENFNSPWGIGRPGWHIECSAMSYKYLGENFDIHGGGADLIFPHHTNEIAQSRCAFPGSMHARYWVHNGFLTVNGEKMSKSLGNFVTVRDVMHSKTPGDVMRLLLLATHYRKPLDYNNKVIIDAKKTLDYWYRAVNDIELVSTTAISHDFMESLLDDLNTPLSIKIINDHAQKVFTSDSEEEKKLNASYVLACANFLGLMTMTPESWFHGEVDESSIYTLINERANAKAQKNWLVADRIRKQLENLDIILEDNPNGQTIWRKK